MLQRPVYASLSLERRSQYAGRGTNWKYINDVVGRAAVWYDLVTDPMEQSPLSSAPSEAVSLARFASRIATRGRDGLHILVTGSLLEEHTIEGTVKGDALGEFGLRYLANNGTVDRTPDGIAFRIVTSPGPNCPWDFVSWHEDGAEQNNAHLRIALDPQKPVYVSIRLDDNPAPESLVFVGRGKTPRRLVDTQLLPRDLTAGPQAFDPALLPRRLAVYLWYVPGPDTIADDDLDPGMVRALHTLGYL